jgi:hypothetical protein
MDPLEKQLQEMSEPNPVPTPTPAPETPSETVYGHDHKNHISPIRTFSSDMAEAVRSKGGSVVRIAIAEDERKRREKEEVSITSTKNMFFTLFGVIVVAGAIVLGVWAYMQKQNAKTITPATTNLPTSLVASDSAQGIDITNLEPTEIVARIREVVATEDTEAGTVKNIVLATGPAEARVRVTASEFLSAIKTHADTVNFSRYLQAEFMLGTYRYEANNLFFVVHGTDHDNLLAGMLAWEPYLFRDMIQLFKIDTSGFTASELQSVPFADTVIANRDTRAVLDANRKPLFFYSFLNQNTLIFAADAKTLSEVIRRF